MVPAVVAYFHKNLKHMVEIIQRAPTIEQSYIDALIRIFDGDARYRRFYNKYGLDQTAAAAEQQPAQTFAKKPVSSLASNSECL